jgi:hypothetical protein
MIDGKYGKVTLEKKPDAPEDEPCFVLRAQDELAADAVRAYADSVEDEIGKDQADVIRKRADEMEAWPTKKLPD